MNPQTVRFSQNFLKYSALIKKLVFKARINSNDTVLEIGAGKGIITEELANVAKHVITYEIDENLITVLYSKFKDNPKVTLIHKDFLKENRDYGTYKVFANIPFNKTSEILNKIFFSRNTPTDCYVIVQKEAAYRYMGKGEGTLLSMLLRPLYALSIIHTLSKTDFDPAPSVDSVLFNLKKKSKPAVQEQHLPMYRDFLCYVLNQQKPTLWLRTNKLFTKEQFVRLSKNLNFDLSIAARDVSYDTWIKLFDYYLTGVVADKKILTYGAFMRYIMTKDKQKKVHKTKVRPQPVK